MMSPVKFGKSSVQVNRETKKKTVQHEYMKTKTNDELIESYNKESTKPKLKQKIKNEIVRRNKIGQANIIFTAHNNIEDSLGL